MNIKNKSILLVTVVFMAAAPGCKSDLTAQAPAQITRVAIDRDTKTSRKKTSSGKTRKKTKTSVETEIDYRFTVGGKTFEGYSEKDGDVQGDFQTGSAGAAVVCYNPSNPEESDVFAAGHQCGD